MSGDDKFMTRWVVKKGWKMRMQLSPECTLATTFKADGRFFKQILRWTRNTWRSDFKSLVLERTIWWRYPIQVQPSVCCSNSVVVTLRWFWYFLLFPLLEGVRAHGHCRELKGKYHVRSERVGMHACRLC
jgi:hypothetical protein